MRLLRVGDGPPPGRDRRGTMATGMGCHGARIPAPGLHLSLLLLAALLVLVAPGLAQPAPVSYTHLTLPTIYSV